LGELSANDDFHFADSLVNYKFEHAVDYFVTVRDVDFNGTASFTDVLQTTDRPFVTAAIPLAVAPSNSMSFQVAGFKLTLDANETKGRVVIEIAPDAKHVERVPLSINANVSIIFTNGTRPLRSKLRQSN
jgi:hypothetical protein